MNALLKTLYDPLVMLALLVYSIGLGILKQIVPYKYRCKSVKDEICIVTGSGSGIGKLMSKKFAKLGARLILVDINQKDNEETANEILKEGGNAQAFTVDLSSREEIYKFADEVYFVFDFFTSLFRIITKNRFF